MVFLAKTQGKLFLLSWAPGWRRRWGLFIVYLLSFPPPTHTYFSTHKGWRTRQNFQTRHDSSLKMGDRKCSSYIHLTHMQLLNPHVKCACSPRAQKWNEGRTKKTWELSGCAKVIGRRRTVIIFLSREVFRDEEIAFKGICTEGLGLRNPTCEDYRNRPEGGSRFCELAPQPEGARRRDSRNLGPNF